VPSAHRFKIQRFKSTPMQAAGFGWRSESDGKILEMGACDFLSGVRGRRNPRFTGMIGPAFSHRCFAPDFCFMSYAVIYWALR